MIYVFHHNDIDGHASAALVRLAHTGKEFSFVECDYSFSLIPFIQEIQQDDMVYVVDYSFKENTLHELKALMHATDNLVWIDHHVCSVQLVEQHLELVSVKGVLDMRYSAAALVYTWFHKGAARIPYWIQLVSDYDTWAKQLVDTDAFNYGMLASDWSVESDLWESLTDDVTMNIVRKGESVLEYIKQRSKSHLKSYGFVTEFAGYKCLAVNSRYESSMIFDSVRNQYPVCVMFEFTGRCWKYSLYTNGRLDASQIASIYGGGGHAGAAGFTTDTLLPCFTKEISE